MNAAGLAPAHTGPRASLQATIDTAPVATTLQRLHAQARRDRLRVASLLPATAGALLRGGVDAAQRAFRPARDRAFDAVSPAQGRFAYLIARAINAQSIIEFGASCGVCTLYLAAAAYDNFGGRVITTERSPEKATRARDHLNEAGLAPWVELRVGDALDTLARDLPAQVDLVVLDGDGEQHRGVLNLLRSRLRPGAVVLAPSAQGVGSAGRLIEELRSGTAGFQSMNLPLESGFEFTVVV